MLVNKNVLSKTYKQFTLKILQVRNIKHRNIHSDNG
jgi:hypothetical protein